MATQETQSLDSLNLSWPHSVHYHHTDIITPDVRSSGSDREPESPAIGSQAPVTTYNGVPRELIRDAEPLVANEVRLLDLRKGVRGMPLIGSLRKARLSDHHVYEPLSYTWSDYDPIQPSNGNIEEDVHPALFLVDTQCFLNLTPNCARALNSVRKSSTERTIWVDSICVNQDDTEERSHQVDLMNEIYARACTVLVYLGRESTEIDSSSKTAMLLLRQPDRLQRSHCLDQHETESLTRLFERTYFRRIWIVQEVALARTIEFHCGPATTYVSKFAGNPLEAIMASRVSPPWLRYSKQIYEERLTRHGTSQAEQILSLIFDTASCDCTDERDRIFALFSLLNPSGEERLRADYNSSTEQVYSGIAAYLATNGFLWAVLMFASASTLNKHPGLPSWVPDWRLLRNIERRGQKSLESIVSNSRALELDTVIGVASSGLITIRGILLGSVTYSELYADMTSDRATYLSKIVHLDYSDWRYTFQHRSTWTLAKPAQERSLDSWQCHFEFETQCKQPHDADHVAFMLSDYSTVLILRRDRSSGGPYTLADIGRPRVKAISPRVWPPDCLPHMRLECLKPISNWKKSHLDIILSPEEGFPGLSESPELWRHNPYTSKMSLAWTAIQEIQKTDLAELALLSKWHKDATQGVRILRDKSLLRLLIDEVDRLRPEDYSRIEQESGLNLCWSFDDFLGLFIKDPFCREPMAWPDVQPHGDQPLDETVLLPQLMQWAALTYRFLRGLWEGGTFYSCWPNLANDNKIYSEAMNVAWFQRSIAAVMTKGDISHCRDRSSFLLSKILRQLGGESQRELKPPERPRCSIECYWDWRTFDSVRDQRFSTLNKIQPEVQKIQAELHDFKSKMDWQVFEAHLVFAAHGFDSRKGFTQIQIK